MHIPLRRGAAAVVAALAALVSACGGGDDPVLVEPSVSETPLTATLGAPDEISATDPVPRERPLTGTVDDLGLDDELSEVVDGRPVDLLGQRGHDPEAFTQGLVFDDERLYESRGQYGESALTEIDPLTGEVLREVALDDQYFAEGLALVDDQLIQLTWREGVAFVYDVATFDVVDQFTYQGEGWGLCYDGEDLWMSDGSSILTRRDPATFEVLDRLPVSLDGGSLEGLNELECLDGAIWANVWLTDIIVVIEPEGGEVFAVLDAAGLLRDDEAAEADVLNGLAYDPNRDVMVVTGKYWPAMFDIDPEP